jgi:MFS family permease
MFKFSAEQNKIIMLSALGGMLEFYDFAIYSIFAAYFSKLFFPATNPLFSILAVYSVFFIGYVIRPIGGIIFSHIGDEYGRKIVMVLTMVLMGLASFGIGVLPTYATIGIAAPILLLLFRLMQGLAFGGEVPSVIIYIAETIALKRGLAIGLVWGFIVAGLLPAMLINMAITHFLNGQQITEFGWRIGFILGGLLCLVSYQVRKKLHETKAFENMKRKHKFPFVVLVRRHLPKVFMGIAITAIIATPFTLAAIFMPTYLLAIVKLQKKLVSDAVFCSIISCVLGIAIIGYFVDKFDMYKVMLVSIIILMVVCPFAYFLLYSQFNLIVVLCLFAFVVGLVITPAVAILSVLFPTSIRLSGIALSYNLGFILFGALCPLIITWGIDKFGHIYLIPPIWLCCVSLFCIYGVIKSRKAINTTKYEEFTIN